MYQMENSTWAYVCVHVVKEKNDLYSFIHSPKGSVRFGLECVSSTFIDKKSAETTT